MGDTQVFCYRSAGISFGKSVASEMTMVLRQLGSNAFMMAGWCNEDAAEDVLKEQYGYTVRCIPFSPKITEDKCFLTGKPAKVQALIAKAY